VQVLAQQITWFARVGFAHGSDDQLRARAYLTALGYSQHTVILPVTSWNQVEDVVRDPRWDIDWWRQEEQERDRLLAEVQARYGSEPVWERLTSTTVSAGPVLQAAANDAARSQGCMDEALIRCASGAAAMACYEHALAELAQCHSNHPFMRKYALFEAGRWPLGIVGDTFHLF
jgi:hypothetical protein